MLKPSDFEEIQIDNFRSVPAGGYVCKIMGVDVRQSSTGKDMLVVAIDIAEGDYKDEYATRFKNDTRPDKKWSCNSYIVLKDSEGKTNRDFKRFITSFEESNKAKVDWTDDKDAWNKQFKNKKIGMLFREEEYESNGSIRTSTKPFQFRSVEKIKSGEFEVPAKKELANKAASVPQGFVPASNEDDLPF